MTPAINELKKYNITFKILKYKHDTSVLNYGLEAASKLNLDEQKVFKTLIVLLSTKELIVAIIPVNKSLCFKKIAQYFKVKNAKMADKDEAQKSSAYILGGISAFGQKKRLRTVLDLSAKSFEDIYVSGGRRGLDLELNPDVFKEVLKANFEDISI